MTPDFWRSRWTENRIAFHEGQPNEFLQRHGAVLGQGKRVLVPLCGKAVDLAWLAAQGHQVVGVELVEEAVRSFFREQGLTPETRPEGAFTVYSVGSISIFAGDFFATTRALLGPVDALYDRAAMVALPPDLRRRYVAHLAELLLAPAPGVLITTEYPQAAMEGPPFSVTRGELSGYGNVFSSELLEARPAVSPRMNSLGADARDVCYRLTRVP